MALLRSDKVLMQALKRDEVKRLDIDRENPVAGIQTG